MEYNPTFLNNDKILNEQQKQELHNLSLKFPLKNFLDDVNLINKISFDFIYSSSQIEGNTYSKNDTLSLLKDGVTANGKLYTDAKMIMNLRYCFDEILANNMEININTLHFLHNILADELVSKQNQGGMRLTNITGITGCSYLPLPTGMRLKTEMEFLFQKYNSIKDPFDRAIYLHNNLCYLQYFEDCNKRTARCMQFLSLIKDNIMPLVILDGSKQQYSLYRNCVVDYYETGNHQNYINFFIEIYKNEMQYLEKVKILQLNSNKKPSSIHP